MDIVVYSGSGRGIRNRNVIALTEVTYYNSIRSGTKLY